MTRSFLGALLFTIAHLAVLPGCRQLPYFQPPAEISNTLYTGGTEVQQRAERDHAQRTKETTSPIEVNRPDKAILEPSPLPKLDVLPKLVEPAKKDSPGVVGVVTLEPGPALMPSSDPVGGIVPAQANDGKRDHVPLLRALEAMFTDRHAEAIKHLQAYDKDTQEVLLRLTPLFTLFIKKSLDELSPQDVAIIDQQLQGFLLKIRPRSELQITKMCYCKRIRGFGSFEPLPDSTTFLTGAGDRPGELVQLYVELKNFVSEPTKAGDYVTKLSCTLELHDQNNRKVWSHSFDRNDTTHRRATRLTDFYSNYSFYVPNLPAGTYQLTVQVVDETLPEARRIARRSLDFRASPIAGQPSLR